MNSQKPLLEEIQKLAQSSVNDAVRLAFLDKDQIDQLQSLDLSAVTEFKRSTNGTVELKFVDRLAALKWLLDYAEQIPKAERLFHALDNSAAHLTPTEEDP